MSVNWYLIVALNCISQMANMVNLIFKRKAAQQFHWEYEIGNFLVLSCNRLETISFAEFKICSFFFLQLYSLNDYKPPISKAKMTQITKAAIKAIKVSYKFYFCVFKRKYYTNILEVG